MKLETIELCFMGAAFVVTIVLGFILVPIIRKSLKE